MSSGNLMPANSINNSSVTVGASLLSLLNNSSAMANALQSQQTQEAKIPPSLGKIEITFKSKKTVTFFYFRR